MDNVIRLTVQVPPGSVGNNANLYLSDYQLVKYQCAPRCSQCNRINNQCLQCTGFFVQNGTVACTTCPNGYFLKRSYSNTTSYSIIKQTDDICVKCHSTCKQCRGP